MTKSDKPASAVSGISTKAELEHRLAARRKPRAELHLTIEGWQAQTVHTHVNSLAENRIKFLEQRLERARNGVKRDHLRARLKGKSRQDFDRSR